MTAPTLVVHGGWRAFGLADFSPFGLKVQTYLRMIGVPYKAKTGDPRKGPTKKLPFIEDGGARVGDSGLIVEYLKKKHGDALDAKLTAGEHALGHVVRRTLEESLYWPLIYSRWLEDSSWGDVRALLVPLLPPVIGGFLADGPIRDGVRKAAFAQGTGRHDRETVYALGGADIDAVGAILGSKPYLLGEDPSSYDAILYAFMANVLAFPTTSPLAARASGHSNLVAYVDRMKSRYWAGAGAT